MFLTYPVKFGMKIFIWTLPGYPLAMGSYDFRGMLNDLFDGSLVNGLTLSFVW